ncbi:hypothetical protein B566_EDAN006636 [Ephemera danica]|nr:hypothetical protein B566_EDAN006636 [Ephemera danica]
MCKKWTLALKRRNFVPKNHSALCSEHFEPSCFVQSGWSSMRYLSVDAVPTIFKGFPLHLQPKFTTPRREIKKHSMESSKKSSSHLKFKVVRCTDN